MNRRIWGLIAAVPVVVAALRLNFPGGNHPTFGSFNEFNKNSGANCFGKINNFNASGRELTVLVKPEMVIATLRDGRDFHSRDQSYVDGMLVRSSGFDQNNIAARDVIVREAMGRCNDVQNDQRTSANYSKRPDSMPKQYTLLSLSPYTLRIG